MFGMKSDLFEFTSQFSGGEVARFNGSQRGAANLILTDIRSVGRQIDTIASDSCQNAVIELVTPSESSDEEYSLLQNLQNEEYSLHF